MDSQIRELERNKNFDTLVLNLNRAGALDDYIDTKVKELAEIIKSSFRIDKELWQQVPYLAWAANGRTGWNDELTRTYYTGYFGIKSTRNRNIDVDCATGELTGRFKTEPLQDYEVIELYNVPSAQGVINYLTEQSNQPMSSVISPRSKSYFLSQPAKIFTRVHAAKL